MTGYLCPGIAGWRNRGKLMDSLGVITALDLKDYLGKGAVTLIDVREEDDYNSGHIPGA